MRFNRDVAVELRIKFDIKYECFGDFTFPPSV